MKRIITFLTLFVTYVTQGNEVDWNTVLPIPNEGLEVTEYDTVVRGTGMFVVEKLNTENVKYIEGFIPNPHNMPITYRFDSPHDPIHNPETVSYYSYGYGSHNRVHFARDMNRGGGRTDYGDNLYTVGPGVVVFIQRIKDDKPDSWGNVVITRHRLPNGSIVDFLFAHLKDIYVSIGDVLEMGLSRTCLGTVGDGNGWYVTEDGEEGVSAHLHMEVSLTQKIPWVNNPDGIPNPYDVHPYENYADPYTLFFARGYAVGRSVLFLSNVRLRSSPIIQAGNVITEIPVGTTGTITSSSEGIHVVRVGGVEWYYVSVNGIHGWVSSYLQQGEKVYAEPLIATIGPDLYDVSRFVNSYKPGEDLSYFPEITPVSGNVRLCGLDMVYHTLTFDEATGRWIVSSFGVELEAGGGVDTRVLLSKVESELDESLSLVVFESHEQWNEMVRSETLIQSYERIAEQWLELGFSATSQSVAALGVDRFALFEVRDGQLTAIMYDVETGEYALSQGLGLYLPGFEPISSDSGGSGIPEGWLPPVHLESTVHVYDQGHVGFSIDHNDQRGLDMRDPANGDMLGVITFEGWYYLMPSNDVLDTFTFVSKSSLDPFLGYRLWATEGGRTLQFHYGDFGPNNGPFVETVAQARNIINESDIQKWMHISVIVYPGLGLVRMFKNGEEQAVEIPKHDARTIYHASGQPFVFGAQQGIDGSVSHVAYGMFRDWTIWGYDRSIEEIQSNDWVIGLGTDGRLIASWRFTNRSTDHGIIDSSGNDNHLNTNTWWWDMVSEPIYYDEWLVIRNAVFVEGDRMLESTDTVGGDAVSPTALPDPAYHFTMDGEVLLGDKLHDSVTGTQFRVDGLLSGASGYDSNPYGAYHIGNVRPETHAEQTFLWLHPDDQLRLNYESFAVGMWVRVEPEWRADHCTPLMIGRHTPFRINLSNGVPEVTDGNLRVASDRDIADGEWHHILGVMQYRDWNDEAARRATLSLYVDALWVGSDDNPNRGSLVVGTDLELTIGGHPAPQALFRGDVDDVIIWQNTDISREQIELYYESSGRVVPEQSSDSSTHVATDPSEYSFSVVPQVNATYDEGILTLDRGYARLSGLSFSPGSEAFTVSGSFIKSTNDDQMLMSMNHPSGGFWLQASGNRVVVTLKPINIHATIEGGTFGDGQVHTFSMSFDNNRAERIILVVDGVEATLGGNVNEFYDLSASYDWLLGAAIGSVGEIGGQMQGVFTDIRIMTP